MKSIQKQRSAGFWVAFGIVAAIFLGTPFLLIEATEGSDDFQDLAFFIGFVFLYSLESIIAIIAGLVFITKGRHPEVGRGILAGLVAGAIGGFVISFIIFRFILR